MRQSLHVKSLREVASGISGARRGVISGKRAACAAARRATRAQGLCRLPGSKQGKRTPCIHSLRGDMPCHWGYRASSNPRTTGVNTATGSSGAALATCCRCKCVLHELSPCRVSSSTSLEQMYLLSLALRVLRPIKSTDDPALVHGLLNCWSPCTSTRRCCLLAVTRQQAVAGNMYG